MSGCHARPRSPARERAAVVLVVLAVGAALVLGALLLALSAAVRLAGRVTAAVWRRLGVPGRLVAAMVAAWPLTESAQGLDLLPDGWLITATVSGTITGACVLALAAVRAHGQWRWRKSAGRAWNEHQGVGPLVAHNSQRLDRVERSLDEILDLMAGVVAGAEGVSPKAKTVPQLRLIQGEPRDEAS